MAAAEPDRELVEIERAAASLAGEAGGIVLDYYRRAIEVEFKDRGRRDPVTAADRAVEEYLAGAVRARFPGHALLGEEGAPGEPSAEYLWVVDPLDGTTNFVNRLPIFAVSIGVLHRRRPVVGAIFLPGPPDLGGGVYHARRGGGAYLGLCRLSAVSVAAPEPSRLASLPGFPQTQFHLGGSLGRAAWNPRTLGSAAAELALVAAGVLQYGLFRSLRIWDVAAGVLLIQEAGGAVYRWRGWLRRWIPLDGFEARPPTPDDPTGLRGWSEPLLAGGVGPLKAALRTSWPTFSLGAAVRRWLHRR